VAGGRGVCVGGAGAGRRSSTGRRCISATRPGGCRRSRASSTSATSPRARRREAKPSRAQGPAGAAADAAARKRGGRHGRGRGSVWNCPPGRAEGEGGPRAKERRGRIVRRGGRGRAQGRRSAALHNRLGAEHRVRCWRGKKPGPDQRLPMLDRWPCTCQDVGGLERWAEPREVWRLARLGARPGFSRPGSARLHSPPLHSTRAVAAWRAGCGRAAGRAQCGRLPPSSAPVERPQGSDPAPIRRRTRLTARERGLRGQVAVDSSTLQAREL
jgi:hypothetical protein